jgi:hypothetical protein
MSDCGSVLSVAEIMEQEILIVSANRKYFECLTELERAVINKQGEPKENSRKHFSGC